MADPLPNRTQNLPDRKYYDPDSTENWADPLEAVIEEVSANAIVTGPNRTDFDPIDGQLYIPTDGGDWFLGNGTGWENLGPVGNITEHVNDTTNPHSVTSDQVGSPSDAEFGSHTGDTTNPHSVTAAQANALSTSGGTVTGDVTVTGAGDIDTLYSTAVTMYVRSDGSDGNSGLSTTDAKASIASALQDAPIQGDSSALLLIDIGTGSFEGFQLFEMPFSGVKVVGATDTNGDPATTITPETGVENTIYNQGTHLSLRNIHVEGAEVCIQAEDRALLRLANVTGANATQNGVEIFSESRYMDDADTEFDMTANVGHAGCLRVFSSTANIYGTYRGDGGGGAVAQCWASGSLYIDGSVQLIGEGSASTDHLIDARDLGHVKTAGAWTAQGAREIFRVRNDAQVKVNDAPTTTDITRRWDIWDGGTGIDDAQGEVVSSVPKMSGVPEGMREGQTGAREGWIVFDQSTGEFKGYNGAGWVVLG